MTTGDRRRAIAEVRSRTDAPMVLCVRAVDATDGNVEAALAWLAEQPAAPPPNRDRAVHRAALVGENVNPERPPRPDGVCPDCGGSDLTSYQAGWWECHSMVLVHHGPAQPGMSPHPLGLPFTTAHTCHYRFPEWQLAHWGGQCGSCRGTALGTCSVCRQRTCPRHQRIRDGVTWCISCVLDQERRASAAKASAQEHQLGGISRRELWHLMQRQVERLVAVGSPEAVDFWDPRSWRNRRFGGPEYAGEPARKGWLLGVSPVSGRREDPRGQVRRTPIGISTRGEALHLEGALRGRHAATVWTTLDMEDLYSPRQGSPTRATGLNVEFVASALRDIAARHGVDVMSAWLA